MPRQRKNVTKLLTIFLILVFEIGCAGAPVKPSVELGVLDVPAQEVIVNNTAKMEFSKAEQIEYDNLVAKIILTGNRVPIIDYDKAISFKPDQWAILAKYVKALEQYIGEHNCVPKP